MGKDSRYANWRYTHDHTMGFVVGDMHLANFAAYDDGNGDIVYDVSGRRNESPLRALTARDMLQVADFQQVWVTDYQVDLWRMAASTVIQGAMNGLSEDDQEFTVKALVAGYLRTMQVNAPAPRSGQLLRVLV